MLKFYLHDAVSTVAGTLPSGGLIDGSTPQWTATGAATNRSADDTIGGSQVSVANATQATTVAQYGWFRRFISVPLAAQTIGTATHQFSLGCGASESNSNSNFKAEASIGFWRPSTGAVVQYDASFCTASAEAGTSETWLTSTPSSAFINTTLLDGDVMVIEITRNDIAQSMGTSYTNTFFYDGTTEGSATSAASYILCNVDIPVYTEPELAPKVIQRKIRTAVNRAASRCWTGRKSGILVPKLWVPESAMI